MNGYKPICNMTIAQIDVFIKKIDFANKAVKVSFRSRDPFIGFFVNSNDYNELKGKNFWRIIGQNNITNYQSSGDMNLSKIFSGFEITSLKIVEMIG